MLDRSVAEDPAPVEISSTPVAVLDKCVAILGAVERGARTLGDLQRTTRVSRATAHRLASALETHGLLARDVSGIRLGPRLVALATAAASTFPLRELAHPALARLTERTGESSQLYIRSGDVRVCIDVVESGHELRTIVPLGASLPLTAGSAGKVLLAWSEDAQVDRILTRLPRDGAVDRDRLGRQLPTTRRRGWGESVEEREPGVASVSSPVFDRHGQVLAAVSVSGPVGRLSRAPGRRFSTDVLAAAREIEAAIGTPARADSR